MRTKKMRMLINLIISLIIIMLIAAGMWLYFVSDIFKTKEEIFYKYTSKVMSNLSEIMPKEQELDLQNNNYTENIEIIYNVKNEDYEGNLVLAVDGKTDVKNEKAYNDVNLKYNEQSILKIETLKNEKTYGIRFPEIVKQYISVENDNLKDLFEKFDVDINNTPNKLNINTSKKLTDANIQHIKDNYIVIIKEELQEENFSKETNQNIILSDKQTTGNIYSLNLTTHNLNTISTKTLQKLKEDAYLLQQFTEDEEEITILKQEIDKIVKNIEEQEVEDKDVLEIKIYQVKGNVVKISFITDNKEISIEFKYENKQIKSSIIQLKTLEEEVPVLEISVNKIENGFEFIIQAYDENLEKKEIMNIEYLKNSKNQKSNTEKIKLQCKTDIITYVKNIEITEKDFKDIEIFNEENNIKINTMDKERILETFGIVLSNLGNNINKKIEETKFNEFTSNSYLMKNIIVDKGSQMETSEQQEVIEEQTTQEENEVYNNVEISNMTQTEVNDFNNKIEIYAGESISGENVKKLFLVLDGHIEKAENTDDANAIKITIKKGVGENNIIQTLNSVVKDKHYYKISLKYDEQTGIITSVTISI